MNTFKYAPTRAMMLATTTAVAMFSSHAFAAEAEKTGVDVEEIVVVGSQIRGAKETGALPVSVVGSEAIKAVGAVSGDDLFRSIPQAGDVTFNSGFLGGTSPNGARGDVSTVSLRGLGQGNTLSMLNGRRMVLHPTSQADVNTPVFGYNVNAIPVAGLARVEVLRDGAAALYGSDAVAGVVNNVLRSDFEGLETEVQYGGAESTHLREFEAHMLGGTAFAGGRGNISLFLGYTDRTALLNSDQDFTSTSDRRSLVGGSFALANSFDNRGVNSAWGAFQAPAAYGTVRSNGVAVTSAGGLFHVQPVTNGGCSYVVSSSICYDDGNINGAADRNLRLDSAKTFTTTPMPAVKRFNAFSFINYDLNDDIRLFSELGYYTATTHQVTSPTGSLSSTLITVPASNYWNPFGAVTSPNRLPGLNIPAAGIPVTILSYNFVDSGPREIDVENEQYRVLGGVRGKKFGFDWESAALYSAATVKDTSDYISNTLLEKQLSLSTPDAYNPFSGGNPAVPNIGDSTPNPASSVAPFMFRGTRANKTTLALWDFKVSRPDLFQLPGGELGIAAGIEWRAETYRDNRDPRQDTTIQYTDPVTGIRYGSDMVGASPSPDVSGKRSVRSAYLELAVPVVGPDMNIPLVRSIDLQLAGRFEDYSDVGSVAKPKIAGSWDVFDGLRLRSSWSQGFRAPNLEQLHTPVVERFVGRNDYILCEADLRAKRIATFSACNRVVGTTSLRSGNPDLKPETSTSFSYGLVFQPKFDPAYGALTITVDRWRIKQKGVGGVFDDQNALIQDYMLRLQGSSSPLVIRKAPTADDIAAVAGTGLAPVGEVLYVPAMFENLLPLDVQGLDIGATYRFPDTPLGRFDTSLNVTHLIKYFQAPSAQIQELLDARAAGKINAAVPITGAADLIRQSGRPRWKWSATVNWSYGPFQAALFTQYIDPVEEPGILDLTNAVYKVDSQLTFNLYGQYKFEGDGWMHSTTVRIGARNITNKAPPLSSGGYLSTLYQPYARYWYGSISKSF